MSLSSKKSALAVRERVQFDNLNSALAEWGYEWKNQQLIDIEFDDDSLSEADISSIELNNYSKEEMKKFLAHKSRGAKYLGWQIWNNSTSYDIKKICSDWAALKDIRHWMSKQPIDDLKKMDLLITERERVEHQYIEHYRFQPQKLMSIGVRFAWQAERFCALYKEICVEKRPWGSCFQPDHQKVLAIATTPNYNRLPLWVKKILVNSPNPIQTVRVGNIWRLIDCAKAWKHAPGLPKRIAEKVGNMSVRSRIIAGFAWKEVMYSPDRVNNFWMKFQELLKMPLLAFLEKYESYDKRHYLAILAEISIGLPYGFLKEVWGLDQKRLIQKDIVEETAKFANPADVCEHYFGTKGNATVKAFANCSGKHQWKWASALAFGKPDLVQKYLALPSCIDFEPDAFHLLQELGDGPALRMVATITFKVRGEVKPVEKFHVKDSGYIWNNLQAKPELGRVRCWLSLHEDLARQFVKEQPNERLKIHPDWQPLDGLCAIDGSWEIELPRCTSTLKYWGEKLSHCVGGYGPKINKGDCVIFAVKVASEVKYTVEMCPSSWSGGKQWDCNQFYGVRNSSAPYELKKSVLGAIGQVVSVIE